MRTGRHGLWLRIKKIVASFGSPDEGGSAAGDIKAIRAKNAIKRIAKNRFLWLYYTFCAEYKRMPVDIDDMCDGLICIRAKNKVQEIYGEVDA